MLTNKLYCRKIVILMKKKAEWKNKLAKANARLNELLLLNHQTHDVPEDTEATSDFVSN
jgi:hypothetical protein